MGSKLVLVFYFFSICKHALREKCPCSELFWSVYSRIRTEYGKIPVFSPTAGNTDQKNSEYGNFSRSDNFLSKLVKNVFDTAIT